MTTGAPKGVEHAPTPYSVHEFFHAIGVPVAELRGMSECVLSTSNPPSRIKLGTVGMAIPGVEVKLAEDGEILVRGPNVTKHYRNDSGRALRGRRRRRDCRRARWRWRRSTPTGAIVASSARPQEECATEPARTRPAISLGFYRFLDPASIASVNAWLIKRPLADVEGVDREPDSHHGNATQKFQAPLTSNA